MKSSTANLVLLLIFAILLGLLLLLTINLNSTENKKSFSLNSFSYDLQPACGTIRIFNSSTQVKTNHSQSELGTTIRKAVFNTNIRVMDDNDLRGFIDGTFKRAWSQAGQAYTRVGRRNEGAEYGEYELFRTLQRWEPLDPPLNANLQNLEIRLAVEHGNETDLFVYLYTVNKDWVSGKGGILQNNLSIPNNGEVWWLDRSYEKDAWSLPGAGFANDNHERADTPAHPISYYHYKPGDRYIRFNSNALTAYATSQIEKGEPLLFLIRLDSQNEDTPGAILQLYSGEYSHQFDTERRPQLYTTWSLDKISNEILHPILLPIGEQKILPIKLNDLDERKNVFVDLIKSECNTPIYARTSATSQWHKLPHDFNDSFDQNSIEIIAGHRPISLNKIFKTTFRDTWVTTKHPKEQNVLWSFVSPSGSRIEKLANYIGDYSWEVEFNFNEIGTWSYWWTSNFLDTPFKSHPLKLTVYAESNQEVLRSLQLLNEELLNAHELGSEKLLERYGSRFFGLQRALIANTSPEEFRSDEFKQSRILLNKIRSSLSGQEIPKEIPMKSWRLWHPKETKNKN